MGVAGAGAGPSRAPGVAPAPANPKATETPLAARGVGAAEMGMGLLTPVTTGPEMVLALIPGLPVFMIRVWFPRARMAASCSRS